MPELTVENLHLRYGLLGSWLLVFMIFEREYSTAVYLLAPGTEVIGAQLVSLWQGGAIDVVAALSLINVVLVGIGLALEDHVASDRDAARRELLDVGAPDCVSTGLVELVGVDPPDVVCLEDAGVEHCGDSTRPVVSRRLWTGRAE